jgi:lipopolysaccharide export system protein LptA
VIGPALMVLAALAGPPVKLSGKGEPAYVDAAELQYKARQREIVFVGKPVVTLTRGDAKLVCKKLVVKNDESGKAQTASCQGDVNFTKGARVITCATATYDDPAARVTCEGTPVTLRDQGIQAEGTRLVYDLETDEMKLSPTKGIVAGDRLDAAQDRQSQHRKARQEKPK